MFTISNQTDYAFLFVEYLADKKRPTSLLSVINDLHLPRRYMAHIAAKLASAGIVESREGVSGGYLLKKPLHKIGLYQILKIFEGDVRLVKCADKEYKCQWEGVCNHQTYWKTILADKVYGALQQLTVADVLSK